MYFYSSLNIYSIKNSALFAFIYLQFFEKVDKLNHGALSSEEFQ